MARTKTKRVKNSHAVYHGKEPDWTKIKISKTNYQSELSTGLNYYATIPLKDKRKYFVAWAKTQGKTASDISGIPTEYLYTISSLCRMIERGFPVDKKDILYMTAKLEKLLQEYPPKIKLVTPQDDKINEFKRKEKEDTLIGDALSGYDHAIDEQMTSRKQVPVPTVDLSKLNVTQKAVLANYYTDALVELRIVYSKTDKELSEGYVGIPRVQIKRQITLHINILDDIQRQQILAQAKKPRKTRSRKVKTAEELTKKIKYLPSHKEYGILSINPSKLIGCSVAWVFNTKNRKLQYYYSDSGLTVKGTTIQNFSTDKSSQKTVRKPDVLLKELMDQPRVRSEKLFKNINSKASPLTGRINEHCILLKVY